MFNVLCVISIDFASNATTSCCLCARARRAPVYTGPSFREVYAPRLNGIGRTCSGMTEANMSPEILP